MDDILIIGVTGGSGSGKTYLVRKVVDVLPEGAVAVISQDNYYRPIEEQVVDNSGVTNFDLPTALHLDQFQCDIERLKQGETIERKEYVFNNSHATPGMIVVSPARVIIVEGLFLLHDEAIVSLLDLCIFIDVRREIKLQRRIARDNVERNYPLDDVQYRFAHHVTPAYDTYINPYRNRADLVIHNNRSVDRASELLIAYIRRHLEP